MKVTIKEISSAIGRSAATVSRMAKRESWPYTETKIRGGYRRHYQIDKLPDKIKKAFGYDHKKTSITIGPGIGRPEQENMLIDIAKMSPEDLAIAEARLWILQARDNFIKAATLPVKRGSLIFCQEYKNGNIDIPDSVMTAIGPGISWSSLNRWAKNYKIDGLAGLAKKYKATNKGSTIISSQIREFIKGMLVQHPHAKPGKIMDAIEARFASTSTKLPHPTTVRRYIKKWKKENASLVLFLSNPDEWRSKHQFAMGSASEGVERLNQLWEFDSTPADVMLIDGRHTIIGVIDVYSRRGKLLVSKTSKSTAIAALTRRALLDWGVPETVKTDNGSDYVSRHMVRVFNSLEIEQVLCPPFTPEGKPHIERFFKTFSHDIVEFLPGYIGHSVTDRKAIEARRSFASRLMKRDETVEIEMTAAEFQTICDRWCEAIYHQNQHSGLGGKRPAEMVRSWIEPVRKIKSERALDILLAPAPADGGIRVIGKKGVRVENTHFLAPEMAAFEGRPVQVLLDAADLGTIYLFHADGAEKGNFICVAVDPTRTGHDRAEIAAKTKARQAELMREGRKRMKKLAREQAVEQIYHEIIEHREGKNANIIEIPRPTDEYTTKALEEAVMAVSYVDKINNQHDELENLIGESNFSADIVKNDDINQPTEQKKGNVIPLFTCMTDRYQYIKKNLVNLSEDDVAFLVEFYETRSGQAFLQLDGDLLKVKRQS